MKDFIKGNNHRRVARKKNAHHQSKSIIAKNALKKIIVAILSIIGILFIIYFSVFSLLPNVFSFNNAKSILLVNRKNDCEIGKISIAFFFPNDDAVIIKSLEENEKIAYSDFSLCDPGWEKKVRIKLNFIFNKVIDEVYLYEDEVDLNNIGGLKTILKNLFFEKKMEISQMKAFLRMYLYSSRSDVIYSYDDNDLDLTKYNIGNSFVCSVVVVNTTQVSGLARRFAFFLESNGNSVIKESSRIHDGNTSVLYMQDEENSACQTQLKSLKSLFNNELLVTVDPEISSRYRADIIIFLAEDMSWIVDL